MFPTNRLLLKNIYFFQKEPVSFARPRYVPWGSDWDYAVMVFSQAEYTDSFAWVDADMIEKPEY